MRNLSAILMLLVAGCAGEIAAPAGPVSEGLEILSQSPNALEGVYLKEGTRISFAAYEPLAGVAHVRFDVGGKVLTYDLDYNHGVADFNAHDAALTPTDLLRLNTLAEILQETMPAREQRTRVEDAIVRQSALLAVAPHDEALPAFQFVNDQSITCISCSCYVQYIGNGYYRQAGQGWGCTGGSGNGCKGHCGAGCSSNLSGNYTRDCARHDYGLASWFTASDDYSMGGCWCNAR
jgi:hypothetical protein